MTTKIPTSVLIADDDRNLTDNLADLFRRRGIRVDCVYEPEAIAGRASQLRPDVLLLDVRFPGHAKSGVDVLPDILDASPNTCVIVFTGHGSVEMAVKAMRLGAWHLFEKTGMPFYDLFDVVTTVFNRKVEFENEKKLIETVKIEAKIEAERNYFKKVIQLTNGVAHNVKNRALHLKLLREELPRAIQNPESLSNWLSRYDQTVQLLQDRVKLLYEYSKIRDQPQEPINLASCVANGINSACASLSPGRMQQIQIANNVARDVQVRANHKLLVLAVETLIENAFEALRSEPGQISINSECRDGVCLMTVSDTGCGFTQAGLERATQEFFTTKGQSNFGYGLFFASQVAQSAGGDLTIGNNKTGPGAWVQMKLVVVN